MTRRNLLGVLAGTAGLALLSACGGSQPAAKPAEAPKPTEAAKPAAPAATTAPAPAAAATTAPAPAAAAKPADAAKPAASTGGGATGGQISMQWTKPLTFNTLYSTAGLEQGVERLMFGALVRVNDKIEAVPDLAEKIDVSPDAKTYTFHLKKGITFTDGKPLTSSDVR